MEENTVIIPFNTEIALRILKGEKIGEITNESNDTISVSSFRSKKTGILYFTSFKETENSKELSLHDENGYSCSNGSNLKIKVEKWFISSIFKKNDLIDIDYLGKRMIGLIDKIDNESRLYLKFIWNYIDDVIIETPYCLYRFDINMPLPPSKNAINRLLTRISRIKNQSLKQEVENSIFRSIKI